MRFVASGEVEIPQKIYTVRAGDSLSSLARLSGTSVEDLLRLNPQIKDANIIAAGQMIVLPMAVDRSQVLLAAASEVYPGSDPDWLKVAGRELGVHELTPSNPRIVEYLASCSDLSKTDINDDGTPWCSAFANWCFRVCGIIGTNSASASSWRNWGNRVEVPRRGTVVVWERSEGPEGKLKVVGGHVSFFLADQGDTLLVRGGNQGDAVSERSYPKAGYLSDTVMGGQKIKHFYKIASYREPKGA